MAKLYTKEEVEKIANAAIEASNKSVFAVSRLNVDEVHQWILDEQDSDRWKSMPQSVKSFLLDGFNGILTHIRPTEDEIKIWNEFDGD